MTGATLKSVDALLARGLIETSQADALADIGKRYAIAIPPHVQRHLSAASDPNHALARQFVPDPREWQAQPFEIADPIGDQPHSPVKGIVHRYPNRVLFKPVRVCPVYCRFCFRRETIGPNSDGILSATEIDTALAYIASHPEIEEVIFTGGDPLIMAPRRIAELTSRVSNIVHVRRLRWHTRVPVVAPERVTAGLVTALKESACPVRIAIHANHASEFNPAARRACDVLREAGFTLLSQSVLLAGINDTPNALADLFAVFKTAGLEPYYLHQLDKAPGTHHFRVSLSQGIALMRTARVRLANEPIPRFMLDLPGGYGKVPIEDRARVRLLGHDPTGAAYRIRDPFGRVHVYLDPDTQLSHHSD